MSETGQPAEVNPDDPDVVDGGQPRNQYEGVDVPLGANVADQRATEDEAAGRNQRRRRQREPLGANQVRQGGAIYTRPGDIPRGNVDVQSDDNNYVQMQLMDAGRPPNAAELGSGGGEHVDAGRGQGQYDVVPGGEMLAHINAGEDAGDSLREQAAAAEAAQNARAAQAARYRKIAIANSVLGGIAILGTIGAVLYAYFTRPRESDGPIAMDVDGGDGLDPTKKASVDVAGRARRGRAGLPSTRQASSWRATTTAPRRR